MYPMDCIVFDDSIRFMQVFPEFLEMGIKCTVGWLMSVVFQIFCCSVLHILVVVAKYVHMFSLTGFIQMPK